jgi:hypothetical protein
MNKKCDLLQVLVISNGPILPDSRSRKNAMPVTAMKGAVRAVSSENSTEKMRILTNFRRGGCEACPRACSEVCERSLSGLCELLAIWTSGRVNAAVRKPF